MIQSSIKTIIKALNEHDKDYLAEIKKLQDKLDGYMKERETIIKALKENKIDSLKWYFGIE